MEQKSKRNLNRSMACISIILCLLTTVVLANDSTAQEADVKLIKRFGVGIVNSIAWSPDGRIVALGTDTGIHLALFETLDVFSFPEAYGDNVSSVAFSPNGSMITSACEGEIRLWDASGKLIDTLKKHETTVDSLDFSPDGKLLASAGSDKKIKIWDTSNGHCILKGRRMQYASTNTQ